jgi:hypothetical protein
MNANRRVTGGGLLILATLTCFVGCMTKGSKYNAETETAAEHSTSGGPPAAAAMQAGASLMNQLGGMSGVTQLADAFGANLSGNPLLSQVLDATAVSQTKMGLVNEIAKASGVAPPNPGADMFSTLSSKSLNADQVGAVTSALSSAADQVHLAGAQKSAVMGLLTPITNKLLGK